MKTLHMMVGLPRSGKSTVARALGHPIACPDVLRQALHGTPFRKEIEPLVWALADVMVKALFAAGHKDVTLDACNMTVAHRRRWNGPWKTRYYCLQTPKRTCLARARRNKQLYLIPVINSSAASADPVHAVARSSKERTIVVAGNKVKVIG